MFHVKGDEQILGYLGRSLSLELSAVQLYSTQSMLVASWGLSEAAEKFRSESREEMQHAERIIARMLALGVSPNASQLRPTQLGSNLMELLEYDYQFENDLINLYSKAVQHSASVGDSDSRVFFEQLLKEEQTHSAELTQWMKQVQ